ncbi:MAG: hypothetical protein A3H02_01525 [Candidatus Niyogibacteria bacterium RIFCSPLOWO2_12_FULL_41_13]|uniref:DUF11 domain-containing protein n=1 Tax=Candidatus Niyogibacteria bacterium RIFCSPLOWO2_12_FULL_41_13 TaxID=1801726 RepID=A0A1G2F444_9BACT|nr:MAG: hypothetical protein A3H02_01525 [Candidatus Niyogibacteria bacterium RIFCSPLOWO2_12_FULL_41_13]
MTELEKLEKRLYKPNEKFKGREKPPELTPSKEKAKSHWKEEESQKEPGKETSPTFPIFRFLIILLVGLILTLAGLFWYLFVKGPSFSPKNIVFELNSPEKAKVGELAKFEIKLSNKNEIPLASTDIVFEYPENAKPIKEETKKTLRERRKIGRMEPNEEIKEIFEAYVFGESGKEYEFKAGIEFRFEGSNIISEKEISGKIKISGSPIGINIEGPEEINSGQAIKLQINYLSSETALFKNLILEAEYPPEFEFKKAEPSPVLQNKRWAIGDLGGDKRNVVIEGILKGNNLEEKYFKIRVGEMVRGEFNVYGESVKKISIKQEFLEAVITTDAKDQIALPGQTVRGEIKYKNNLASGVENVKIELEIFGKALDERSVAASQGYYLGNERKIVWQEGSFRDLKYLESGEEGQVGFQFKLLEKLPVKSSADKNFIVDLKAKIETASPPPDYQEINLASESSLAIKVASALVFSRQGFYYYKDFPPSGPIPPRVGKKTIYTVIFSLANDSNDISGLEIRSFLPNYMIWENKILSGEKGLEYNDKNREIIWKIPRLEAGEGVQTAFQIGLAPSLSQINASPVILGETFLRGQNEFTQQIIEEKKAAMTTELRDDPKLTFNDWRVKE